MSGDLASPSTVRMAPVDERADLKLRAERVSIVTDELARDLPTVRAKYGKQAEGIDLGVYGAAMCWEFARLYQHKTPSRVNVAVATNGE